MITEGDLDENNRLVQLANLLTTTKLVNRRFKQRNQLIYTKRIMGKV